MDSYGTPKGWTRTKRGTQDGGGEEDLQGRLQDLPPRQWGTQTRRCKRYPRDCSGAPKGCGRTRRDRKDVGCQDNPPGIPVGGGGLDGALRSGGGEEDLQGQLQDPQVLED